MPANFEVPITLPIATPLPRRLLDVMPTIFNEPSVDPESGLAGESGEYRWLYGVKWQPWPCRGLQTGSVDVDNGTLMGYTVYTDSPWVSQKPFTIADAMRGEILEKGLDGFDSFLADRFRNMVSAAFATELITGTASTGWGFADVAHAPTQRAFGTAATPIWSALAILENDLGSTLKGGQGYLHMTPGLLAQACATYDLELVDGQWKTPLGNIVVADAGYVSTPQPNGQGAGSASTDWVYASGPVHWASTEMQLIGAGSELADLTRNSVARYVAGYGILVFDFCPVAAVLASYNDVTYA